jgi:hypothetical protein
MPTKLSWADALYGGASPAPKQREQASHKQRWLEHQQGMSGLRKQSGDRLLSDHERAGGSPIGGFSPDWKWSGRGRPKAK